MAIFHDLPFSLRSSLTIVLARWQLQISEPDYVFPNYVLFACIQLKHNAEKERVRQIHRIPEPRCQDPIE